MIDLAEELNALAAKYKTVCEERSSLARHANKLRGELEKAENSLRNMRRQNTNLRAQVAAARSEGFSV